VRERFPKKSGPEETQRDAARTEIKTQHNHCIKHLMESDYRLFIGLFYILEEKEKNCSEDIR